MQLLFILILHFNIVLTKNERIQPNNHESVIEESLSPYNLIHGSRLSHRSIRDCHLQENKSSPHELYLAHKSPNLAAPATKIQRFVKNIGYPFEHRIVRGHIAVISNPLLTLSVFEPNQPGGCNLNIRQTVHETSKDKCLVAINAGYFNTKSGSCLGNVISNGQVVHDSKGIQNAHFGITKDGQIFIGYVSEEDVLSGKFQQLVGGVVWLIRNGTGFVNSSSMLECEDTEETGPMDRFTNIVSARTSVGHDKEGNVVFLQIDGKSDIDGINLFEMETLLKSFGVVNAINLDGGGSSTFVINGTTANYPYDECDNKDFACDRKVSTILCVHSPYCNPMNCNDHGTCVNGQCICDANWLPPKCDELLCLKHNCSNNGICSNEGCLCHPGFSGQDCSQSCNSGWYGNMCSKQCNCMNSYGCDPITGACLCKSGFSGSNCQQFCDPGFFGENCHLQCQCKGSCYCDPISGACELSQNTSLYKAAVCVAGSIIKEQNLVQDNPDEKKKWFFTITVLGAITSLCLASLLILLCCSCSCHCRNEQVLCFKRAKKQYRKYPLKMPSGLLSESSDSETFPMQSVRKT